MARRQDFSRSGYSSSNEDRPHVTVSRGTGGFWEFISTSIKLILIFSMVRIVMLVSGMVFISVPVVDRPLRVVIEQLKSVTTKVDRFWQKYR